MIIANRGREDPLRQCVNSFLIPSCCTNVSTRKAGSAILFMFRSNWVFIIPVRGYRLPDPSLVRSGCWLILPGNLHGRYWDIDNHREVPGYLNEKLDLSSSGHQAVVTLHEGSASEAAFAAGPQLADHPIWFLC